MYARTGADTDVVRREWFRRWSTRLPNEPLERAMSIRGEVRLLEAYALENGVDAVTAAELTSTRPPMIADIEGARRGRRGRVATDH